MSFDSYLTLYVKMNTIIDSNVKKHKTIKHLNESIRRKDRIWVRKCCLNTATKPQLVQENMSNLNIIKIKKFKRNYL